MEREPNKQPGRPDPSATRRSIGDTRSTEPTTREFYRLAVERLLDLENAEPDGSRSAAALARVAEFRILVTDASFDGATLRALGRVVMANPQTKETLPILSRLLVFHRGDLRQSAGSRCGCPAHTSPHAGSRHSR